MLFWALRQHEINEVEVTVRYCAFADFCWAVCEIGISFESRVEKVKRSSYCFACAARVEKWTQFSPVGFVENKFQHPGLPRASCLSFPSAKRSRFQQLEIMVSRTFIFQVRRRVIDFQLHVLLLNVHLRRRWVFEQCIYCTVTESRFDQHISCPQVLLFDVHYKPPAFWEVGLRFALRKSSVFMIILFPHIFPYADFFCPLGVDACDISCDTASWILRNVMLCYGCPFWYIRLCAKSGILRLTLSIWSPVPLLRVKCVYFMFFFMYIFTLVCANCESRLEFRYVAQLIARSVFSTCVFLVSWKEMRHSFAWIRVINRYGFSPTLMSCSWWADCVLKWSVWSTGLQRCTRSTCDQHNDLCTD